jgi:uncharacterized protein YbjT (DUF2867 family)
VLGDFSDFPSLLKALEGIESAYFCYPVGSGISEAAGLFAAAGKQRALKTVVDLSLASARPDNPSPQGRAQWVAEQIFEWAGFGGVHLRIAAFFMENLLHINGPGIRAQGRIANSFGDADLSWISGADVGAMAASLLLNPALAGDRVVLAGGSERLTYPQIAERLTRLSGKTVRYEELTPDAWKKELIERLTARGAPDLRIADHLVAQSVTLRATPRPDTPNLVEPLVGRPAISFDSFVAANLEHLSPR